VWILQRSEMVSAVWGRGVTLLRNTITTADAIIARSTGEEKGKDEVTREK
jgi:hypothetical protein